MGSAPPRVSVIVPVYNAAGFLQSCVSSLARQTASDIEILLVDDGSTDQSRAVAAGLAASDPRITVLDQSHVGPGAARNRGLESARAPYVAFVDADDEVTADLCEAMVHRAEDSGADIIVAKTNTWARPALPSPLGPGPLRAIRGLYNGRISMGAYAKLYRRSFLEEHSLRFPPTIYIEDRHFLVCCLTACARLEPLERVVYRRNMRPESTMHRIGEKHVRDATAAYELDVARLDRALLLPQCGHHVAWATLAVDLFLARAIPGDNGGLRDTLAVEVQRQERLFRQLPGSRVRGSLLTAAARMLHRGLGRRGTDLAGTRAWLRLVKLLAL